MDWIGLDLSCEHLDWIGLDQQKWTHVQLWSWLNLVNWTQNHITTL